jgi:hypothetical protein
MELSKSERADADTAPPGAIVGIAAQSVRSVNVVCGRIPEYGRSLARRQAYHGLQRHYGNVLTLGLTARYETHQRGRTRKPEKNRWFH